MATDYWGRRTELAAGLARLRSRLGETTPHLHREHNGWAPGQPLAPEDYRALQSQIRALKRELLSLP